MVWSNKQRITALILLCTFSVLAAEPSSSNFEKLRAGDIDGHVYLKSGYEIGSKNIMPVRTSNHKRNIPFTRRTERENDLTIDKSFVLKASNEYQPRIIKESNATQNSNTIDEVNFNDTPEALPLALPLKSHLNFRSKQYVRYPSPFPEDNVIQSYSGSNIAPSFDQTRHSLNNSRLHTLPDRPQSLFLSPQQRPGGGWHGAPTLRGTHHQEADMSSTGLLTVTDNSPSDFPGLLGAPPIQYSSLSGPSFVGADDTAHTSVAGTTAILTCIIRNLHNYTVSWVRGRDIRLLTTGLITYTSDKRFVPYNPAGGPDWLLKIHYSRLQDSGAYLCQVSLSPPITRTVYLHVHEAVVTVQPGTEVHVQLGSTLHLECRIHGCVHPVPSWTHGGYPLPPGEIDGTTVGERQEREDDELDGRLQHEDEKGNKSPKESRKPREDNFTSNFDDDVSAKPINESKQQEIKAKTRLLISKIKGNTTNNSRVNSENSQRNIREANGHPYSPPDFYSTGVPEDEAAAVAAVPVTTIVSLNRKDVTPQHSGIYTCTSTCTAPVNVTVHVLKGEELAAIHHQNLAAARGPAVLSLLLIMFLFRVFKYVSTEFSHYFSLTSRSSSIKDCLTHNDLSVKKKSAVEYVPSRFAPDDEDDRFIESSELNDTPLSRCPGEPHRYVNHNIQSEFKNIVPSIYFFVEMNNQDYQISKEYYSLYHRLCDVDVRPFSANILWNVLDKTHKKYTFQVWFKDTDAMSVFNLFVNHEELQQLFEKRKCFSIRQIVLKYSKERDTITEGAHIYMIITIVEFRLSEIFYMHALYSVILQMSSFFHSYFCNSNPTNNAKHALHMSLLLLDFCTSFQCRSLCLFSDGR